MDVNLRLIEAIERWLRFPRVILLYLPLPVMAAIPMFIADAGNPRRALGWAIWLCIPLALGSGIFAGLLGAFTEHKLGEGNFSLGFNAGFIVAWLTALAILFLGR